MLLVRDHWFLQETWQEMLYLAYRPNWIRQAIIVRDRFGLWKRGFVCNHILLTISNTDVGRSTATDPVSCLSITTRSTCTKHLPSDTVISSISIRSFPSQNRNYSPCPARNLANRTGYSSTFRPVLRVNMRLSTSTAASSFLLVNRNFGDSGRKKRNDAVKMLGKAFSTMNIRHGPNIWGSQGTFRAQSWGIISHAKPENGRCMCAVAVEHSVHDVCVPGFNLTTRQEGVWGSGGVKSLIIEHYY